MEESEISAGPEQDRPQAVPWTARDSWLGLAILVPWIITTIIVAFIIGSQEIDLNPGVFIGLAELFLLVPVWWFTVRKYGVGWEALGLRPFRGQALGMGCGLMILATVFNAVYGAFLSQFGLQAQTDLTPIFADLSSPFWLLLAGVVIAPLVEEIFFRGFLFAGLRERYVWWRAAAISSALFALIHFQIAAVVPIFVLGFVFAYLYHRAGSLWPAILMHVSTNGLAMGVAYLAANVDLPT
jgi:membrane protease YdiL (CAAX protease family)